MADRVAAKDTESIVKQGIHFHMISVSATDIYTELPFDGQWYIGDNRGHPVSAQGDKEYIRSSRIGYTGNTYRREMDIGPN